ncbi:hypothetical protein ACFYY8_31600 [Streptosporangium sp. NPDC001559]|uniref:hypothetical protein n=1 Tax=Streptosporangium sp. NPDC001559 TaxID=3366187 RepID=UPI0036EB0871
MSAVTWLAEDGGDAVTGWRWDGREHILNVPQRHISGWSCAWRDVNVTHTHGFVTIPDELLDLVCSVAMRLGSVPSSGGMEAGVRSETIDDYSVTYAAEVVTHASGLLPGEEESLRAWLGSAPGAYVVRSR